MFVVGSPQITIPARKGKQDKIIVAKIVDNKNLHI